MIKKIGLELEGATYRETEEIYNFWGDYCQSVGEDGSLENLESSNYCEIKLIFKPTDTNFFEKLKTFWWEFDWEQNLSCGNHLHFSFSPAEAGLALAWHYEDFLKDFCNIYNSRKYLDRLNNRYCSKSFDLQVFYRQLKYNYKDSSRYYAINFNCFKVYKTVEIRLLPHAQHAQELIESIEKMIALVKKYTSSQKVKEAKKKYEEYVTRPEKIARACGFSIASSEVVNLVNAI